MVYRFEWNQEKAKSNWVRHGVSFDEATTVFEDPLARIFDDEFTPLMRSVKSLSDIQ